MSFVAECLTSATSADIVIWNTILAMDRAFPLMTDADPLWRESNSEEIGVICAQIYRIGPMLADQLSGRLPRELVLFGLASMASVLQDSHVPHLQDRLAYFRILMCRLSIIIDFTALAERGYPLANEVQSQLALFSPPPAAATIH